MLLCTMITTTISQRAIKNLLSITRYKMSITWNGNALPLPSMLVIQYLLDDNLDRPSFNPQMMKRNLKRLEVIEKNNYRTMIARH